MRYRRELDGLRAIAVLPVMLYHAKVPGFQGGFVGVDVFFVISGYLITTLILTDLEAGTFSLGRFYERRARRILPALFTVVLCAIAPAVLLMLPYELVNFAKSVGGVATFTSNFVFWRESGYFAPANDLQPLLHTWSLAIEEQFYVLFPVTMVLLVRWSRRSLWLVLSLVAIGSLGLSEWAARHSYAAVNYYLMPTRAWELLLGSLCALFLLRRSWQPRFSSALTMLGIGLIVWSVLALNEVAPYPGVRALVPTLGAALVVLFASPGCAATRVLGWRPLVAVGLVSYGAYLWHQPLLAFTRLARHSHNISGMDVTLILGASLILAWGSFVFIERPARRNLSVSRNVVFALAGGASVGCLAFAGVAVFSDGFIRRFPLRDQPLLAVNPLALGRYTEQRFRERVGVKFVDHGKRHIAVIGDSYAQDYLNMVGEAGLLDSAEYVTLAIPARCPKYLGDENVAKLYQASGEAFDAESCGGVFNFAHAKVLTGQADIVVLAAHWRVWEASHIRETIERLGLRPTQQLLVVGSKDFGSVDPLRYLELSERQRELLRNPVSPADLSANESFRTNLPQSEFLDVQRVLCGDDATCPVFTPDGHLISYDGSHFTPDGARYAASVVFGRRR